MTPDVRCHRTGWVFLDDYGASWSFGCHWKHHWVTEAASQAQLYWKVLLHISVNPHMIGSTGPLLSYAQVTSNHTEN